MKGKIDKCGNLHIMRAGKMKRQYCPYYVITDQEPCGDWCPMFVEPDKETKTTRLEICSGNLFFNDFTDDRETAKEPEGKK